MVRLVTPPIYKTWDQTASVVFPGASPDKPVQTICERPLPCAEVAEILRLWETPVGYRTDREELFFWWPNGEVERITKDGTHYKFPKKPDPDSMPWTAAVLPGGGIIDYTGHPPLYWGPEKGVTTKPQTPYAYLLSIESPAGWGFIEASRFSRDELETPPFERFGCSRFVRRARGPALGGISAPQANDSRR
jgi:hypothetical protein